MVMADNDKQITITEDNEAQQYSYEELVRHIADAIWRQWQQEHRQARERGAELSSRR